MKQFSFHAPTPFEFEIKDLSEIRRYKRITGVPHRAEFYQIIWIESGESVQTVDFTPVEVSGGQILFVAKNQVISFDTSANYKGQIALFTDLFFNRCECDARFMKQLNLFNPFTGNNPLTVNEKIKTLWQLMKNESLTEYDVFQPNVLHNFLCAFLIEAARQNSESKAQTQNTEYQTALQFTELVEQNYKSLRKVNDYLDVMGVSDKNLSKALQKVIGKTPKQFIDGRILLEAKRMLVYSNESIKEITFQLGFDEPTNFTKYFSKNTNMTPAQFRNVIKK
jgi:AraC-like DNA-binding protein